MSTREPRLRVIGETGVVAIIRLDRPDHLLAVARAIREGGVRAIEFTMTTPGALGVLAAAARELGDEVLLGAGTVLDPETARACILAGATFVVSPALNTGTVELCRRYSVAVLPGALTPTEVVTAWQAGADVVKVFPCGALGGAKYLKSLKAPLPQVEMIPTGGVSLKTAAEFIEAGALALGVGADLVDTKAIRAGQPERVTEAARAYVAAVREARAALVT